MAKNKMIPKKDLVVGKKYLITLKKKPPMKPVIWNNDGKMDYLKGATVEATWKDYCVRSIFRIPDREAINDGSWGVNYEDIESIEELSKEA